MSPQTDRAGSRHARVLALDTRQEIAREMGRIGVHPAGVELMAGKARVRVVKLRGLPLQAAHILKQEMLGDGGDAAVSWQVFDFAQETTDALVMGTEAQLAHTCQKLRSEPFGLPQVADEIEAALRAFDAPHSGELRCRGRNLALGQKTLLMGIINVTPDSFSGDGLAGDAGAAVAQGVEMVQEGADLLDVGGESTRPGAEPVSEEAECERVVPVIEGLAGQVSVPISVDTTKAEVARRALEAGAGMVNDVSGLRGDPGLAAVAAELGAPVVVMHMKGTPRDMQQDPRYENLMDEIAEHLEAGVAKAVEAGVPRDQVVVDPGIGFGKTLEHNFEILRRLRELRSLGQPVLIGTSRKSLIGRVLDLPPEQRLEGTAATVALAIANGADMIRVHEVREMSRVARMCDAILRPAPNGPSRSLPPDGAQTGTAVPPACPCHPLSGRGGTRAFAALRRVRRGQSVGQEPRACSC